jgi:hypothetical protein
MVVRLCTGYPSLYGAALVCTLPSPIEGTVEFYFFNLEIWIGLFQVHSFACFLLTSSTRRSFHHSAQQSPAELITPQLGVPFSAWL